ncbi:MAG: hypothetical protein K0U54_00795 [Bacteroidetes bacterium]|nr:hypothetical protein [Bacteroidota bacterium]
MIKTLLFLSLSLLAFSNVQSQNVQIDGRLQPLLDEFFATCDQYGISYHDKFFKLESIDIVNTLTVSEYGSTLGMVRRNAEGEIIAIDINWMAQIDTEILKVVAFHEFAHYFLEYTTHTCSDCGEIMAVVNSSYFDIVQDWENQVRILFEQSPRFLNKSNAILATRTIKHP